MSKIDDVKEKFKNIEWGRVGKKVGAFAPILGQVLGGPAGGMAGAMIAEALGVENTPTAVAKAIENDPDAAVKIRQLEIDNEDSIRSWAFKTAEIELLDKQNARLSHHLSRMPAVLSIVITLLVGIGAYFLFTHPVPEGNASTLYLLFGALLSQWGSGMTYWFGSSRSSAEKTRMMGGKVNL